MSSILFTLLFSSLIFNFLQALRMKEYKNEIIKLNHKLKVIKPVKSQAEKDIEQIAKQLNVSIDRAKEIYNNKSTTLKGNNKRSLS